MSNTTMQEENEGLKKQNLFLTLRLKSLRKKYHALRVKFDSLQKHFFKGMSVFSHTDEELKDEFRVSTSKYASANGFQTKEVFAILQSAGIVNKVGRHVYLAKPGEYGKYALMVHHDYGCLKRDLLYWNADGVRFLNDLLSRYGKSPKAFLDL